MFQMIIQSNVVLRSLNNEMVVELVHGLIENVSRNAKSVGKTFAGKQKFSTYQRHRTPITRVNQSQKFQTIIDA